MDPLEVGYLKQRAQETRDVRNRLKDVYGEKSTDPNDAIPKYILDDLYSESKLTEDNVPQTSPRIGSEYQVDL